MTQIDAANARNAKFPTVPEGISEAYVKGWNDAIDAIVENAPTVEPKKGKWIRITNKAAPIQMWNCSECGRTVEKNTVLDPDIFFPFCHCGADMRGGAEE